MSLTKGVPDIRQTIISMSVSHNSEDNKNRRFTGTVKRDQHNPEIPEPQRLITLLYELLHWFYLLH